MEKFPVSGFKFNIRVVSRGWSREIQGEGDTFCFWGLSWNIHCFLFQKILETKRCSSYYSIFVAFSTASLTTWVTVLHCTINKISNNLSVYAEIIIVSRKHTSCNKIILLFPSILQLESRNENEMLQFG